MTGLGLSVCTIFLFAGFAFHTRLRFYWDQYLAEMGQLLTQNLRFGSGPLPAVATAESCTPGCTKTFVINLNPVCICHVCHGEIQRGWRNNIFSLNVESVDIWDFMMMRIWRNKRQPGDLCVEVSATLGLIELLSQSNIPLVYWTSVQRKGILFGALHAKVSPFSWVVLKIIIYFFSVW